MPTTTRSPLVIADTSVGAGQRGRLELPIARLTSGTPVTLPIQILHGAADGPTVWLSAAVHGDELCGVEIIRRVMLGLEPRSMAGTVIAIPVANVHGFNTGDRYLPDRRDLNRSFPGSSRGSLAARVANLIMSEVVARSSIGIDFHTGSDHRTNLPQIRADLDDPQTLELASVFAAPIAIHSRTRDGSLRQAGTEAGATVLLYEGGEALRFDRDVISTGAEGTHRVLAHLGVIPPVDQVQRDALLSRRTGWLRAPRSGILHLDADLGATVTKGEAIGTIFDTFGQLLGRLTARTAGLIIGRTEHPLVNQGDAVAHIAEI